MLNSSFPQCVLQHTDMITVPWCDSVRPRELCSKTRTHQDSAGQTLQQVQQLPPILQIREHILDGRLPRLLRENSLRLSVCSLHQAARTITQRLQQAADKQAKWLKKSVFKSEDINKLR